MSTKMRMTDNLETKMLKREIIQGDYKIKSKEKDFTCQNFKYKDFLNGELSQRLIG